MRPRGKCFLLSCTALRAMSTYHYNNISAVRRQWHDSSSTSPNCVSLAPSSEPLQLACKEVWSRGLQRWHRVCGAMTLDADSDRLIVVGGSTRGRGESAASEVHTNLHTYATSGLTFK